MPGPRVFNVEEIESLIPRLEQLCAHLDEVRARLRSLSIRANALELIWGAKVHKPENPDHGEMQQHVADMKRAEEEIEKLSKRVARMGGQLKSLEPPLVDFYGVRDGRLVFWCWTRGEQRVEHWHHVDQGFANRQPV